MGFTSSNTEESEAKSPAKIKESRRILKELSMNRKNHRMVKQFRNYKLSEFKVNQGKNGLFMADFKKLL